MSKRQTQLFKKKSCANRHYMLLLLIFKADILYEFVACWSGHEGWLVSSNFSLMSLGKCFRPHSRWRTSYQGPNCLHARVFMIHTSLLACSLADAVKKKKALLLLAWGGVSDTPPLFFRRSGEWTHADWLCGCVKGYPTSCSPSLQTAAAAESGGSAIFSLLCVCVCVSSQETV